MMSKYVLLTTCIVNYIQCSPSPLFNLLNPSTTIVGGGGGGNTGGGGGGGCRPGYEYIIQTTYQTSYEQQCR